MTEPAYGIIFNREDYDPRPSQPSDLSVIGLVLPAEHSDAATFPLNEPVDFDSSDPAFLAKIGDDDLGWAINAIDDQLADLQMSARIVFVRVAKGLSDAATMANIIGSRMATTNAGNVGTGLYALLRAGAQLGVIPRLIGCPGYTWQTTAGAPTSGVEALDTNIGNGVLTLANPAALTGAQVGVYRVVFTSAANNGGGFEVIDPNGDIVGTGVVGTAFANQIGFTIADGTTDFHVDDEFQITVAGIFQSNPVCAALPSILNQLLAHAVVAAPSNKNDAINWFETLGSGRLIPIDAWRKVSDGDGGTRLEDGAAAILGLGPRVDFMHGGYPFWSFAGQQVQGTIGLKNYFPFSLTDGATAGQELIAAHIGVIERGEVGVETAISSNGFVFAGLYNADTSPTFWFYSKSRGRDFLHLSLLKSVRLRLGVNNVTPHSVQAVLNDMVAIASDLIRNECSIGFKVGFEKDKNSPDDLRQGKFRVFIQTEEPAPIRQVWIDSRPYYQALEVELSTLVAQAATLVPQYLGA